MKIYLKPKSRWGKWSVGLLVFFFLFLGVFFLFVSWGERGGDTFFSNLKLTSPMLLAGLSGVGAFLTGIVALFKNKDFALLVMLATFIGAFVIFWIGAEILFPH